MNLGVMGVTAAVGAIAYYGYTKYQGSKKEEVRDLIPVFSSAVSGQINKNPIVGILPKNLRLPATPLEAEQIYSEVTRRMAYSKLEDDHIQHWEKQLGDLPNVQEQIDLLV